MSENVELVEAGFDFTHFGSAETFKDVLEQVGIDPEESPRADKANGLSWECDEGIIVTSCNPINGKSYRHRTPVHDEGYASYIGITGEFEWVALVVFVIEREAVSIKGRNYEKRAYI